jgi:DMSO reductase anchor subunit
MGTEHRRDVWWSRALCVAAILLVAAAGFCWFDSIQDEHGAAGVDLCLGMIATFGVVMVFYMNEVGRARALRRWAATPVTIAVLDPPPWSYLRA